MLVPGIGEDGQERLIRARVLVVGLGGLGSPAAYYLAAAGVGTLGLLDWDRVELSNLQRQILHATGDIGGLKTRSAERSIAALNPEVNVETFDVRLGEDNARGLVARFDTVVEACDNFETKYLLNDACLDLGKPLATAGILALSGQALFVVPGRTACMRCLVPNVPSNAPTTAELGVLGAVPGMLGSLEAMATMRWLTGLWKPQPGGAGLLHGIDGDTMHLRTLRVPRRPGCRCAQVKTEET